MRKDTFDFESVFEPNDYLYFYQDALTIERTKKEVNFLVKELKLKKTMRILDLACGHGRHTNRLAELGYNVTGIDITKGFLDIALKEAKQKKLPVKYIRQDMREINYTNKFDRILFLFTAFGYFDDETNLKVLNNIARALKRNGLLCFDIPNRDGLMKILLPSVVVEKGNDLMIDIHNFDSVSGRLYNKRIVIRDGKRKEKPFFVRLYSATEIRDILSKVGMKIVKIFSYWDSKPFTSESKRMIIIAKKI